MTVRLRVPEMLGKGMVRAARVSYLRRQVGDTRTLMQSTGSATFADQILTTVANLMLPSVADRTQTKFADRTRKKIADRTLPKITDRTWATIADRI